MKNLKFLIIAVALAFSTSLFANTGNDPIDETKNISTIIYEKLTSQELNSVMGDEKEIDLSIKFRINKDNEIIVMKTSSKDEHMNRYIKEKLNHEILNSSSFKCDKAYFIKVKFQML
jgi:hypothetical protein